MSRQERESEKAVEFVRHVKAHLHEGEQVICKLCGKTVDQVWKESQK